MDSDAEAGYSDMTDDEEPSEPAYISEGQREYISTDSEDED